MRDGRPDPEELLERVQGVERHAGRGRLKIFFGACAGVGKTYAMLEAAQARRRQGADVVVGWVETHGRVETEVLLQDLERLPPQTLSYRGVEIGEFDLDGALERRPSLLLVDELAHTNAPGSRHAKRWLDVEELLAAGIDICTTLNVQHLESLNDVVERITTVTVRETVPDRIFDQADEIELIDLAPDDLRGRMREGKVYLPDLARTAMEGFFRKGNLIALRELALRRTADRVDAQMERYRRDHAITDPWPAGERLLVLIAPSPYAARLVRATKRIAARARAEWIAVHVDGGRADDLSAADRAQLARTLALAERLGGEVVTLAGQDVVAEIVAYARSRNVTRIVVGKPTGRTWRDRIQGSLPDRLIRASGGIDVLVLTGRAEAPGPPLRTGAARAAGWGGLAWTTLVVVACTLVAAAMHRRFSEANLVMIYLVGVMLVATRLRRWHAVVASVMAVAAFDFFFVPPPLTFAVADTQYLITFAVMLAAALVISGMTATVRVQLHAGRARERRLTTMYALGRDLAAAEDEGALGRAAVRHLGEAVEGGAALLLPDESGAVRMVAAREVDALDTNEHSVARWVYDHGQVAGRFTETLPGSQLSYLPLIAAHGTVGVAGVRTDVPPSPDQVHLLEALATQTAMAMERLRLGRAASEAELRAEAEKLRSSLLSSVSHDFRTPLTSIAGAASALQGDDLDRAARRELARLVLDESARLNRLIASLLQVTRLESGAVALEKQWQPLEEAVGAALSRAEESLGGREVDVDLHPDLPLVPADGLLLEQVFYNLLENATKYTPTGSPISISARAEPGWVVVEVADRGPGLPEGGEERAFDAHWRLARGGAGVGLGLTVCRGIIVAHGGTIWAENRPDGGVAFRFRLPLEGGAPEVRSDEEEPTGGGE